jgi:hypothetical protein
MPDSVAAEARLRLELLGLQGERMLSMAEVAELTGLHPDTIKRRYPHLIRKLSPRRNAMKLRDALAIGSAA